MTSKREIEAAADGAIRDLRAFTNPERRAATLHYFPSAMENLGVAVPDIRKVLRRVRKQVAAWPDEDVHALALAILDRGTLEGRQLAYELIASRGSLLHRLSVKDVKRLGRGMDNWTSVDVFACSISGQLWRERELPDAEVLRWSRSRDPWWRRAALVSMIPLNMASRGGSGDIERTLLVCDALADDSHEMVAKGLSWALRALIPVSRSTVEVFLAEHEGALASRVRREVRNKLETGRKSGH